MDAKLRRKLERLGVVKGLREVKASPPPKPPLHQEKQTTTLPGETVDTPYGPTWVIKRHYPTAYQHGRYALSETDTLTPEALMLLGDAKLGAHPAFLDTETTGLAGGTGTLAFLTGIGLWDTAGLHLHQIFLRDPGEERAAMHYIDELLAQASSLLTFNGQSFDLPLLENRFILQRTPPRWRGLPHLDLLLVARLLWRDHLPSRRLGFLETELLGIERTQEDLPSWMIPSAYRLYLETGVTNEMIRILYHNEIDILSLVTLLTHAARLAETPETMRAAAAEWIGVGRLYQKAGHEEKAQAAWQRALEEDTLPPDTAERLWRKIGQQHKHAQAWEKALRTWEHWAARIPWTTEPLVERAKYYEWVEHDLEAALDATQIALARIDTRPPNFNRQLQRNELQHRQARLLRKLKRQAQVR